MKRSLPVISIACAAVLALSVMALAGCGSGSTADDSKALEGKTWKATEIAGVKSVLTTKGSGEDRLDPRDLGRLPGLAFESLRVVRRAAAAAPGEGHDGQCEHRRARDRDDGQR